MQELAKVHELLHVKAPGEGDAGAVDSAERFAAAVQVRCTFFSSQRRAGCTNLAGTATGIAACTADQQSPLTFTRVCFCFIDQVARRIALVA